jgi:hypothetical protein
MLEQGIGRKFVYFENIFIFDTILWSILPMVSKFPTWIAAFTQQTTVYRSAGDVQKFWKMKWSN